MVRNEFTCQSVFTAPVLPAVAPAVDATAPPPAAAIVSGKKRITRTAIRKPEIRKTKKTRSSSSSSSDTANYDLFDDNTESCKNSRMY